MPLPHDYVNYVKITSVDSNGIEHIIYPTRHTSHPFAIQQDECAYEFDQDGTIKHQVDCSAGTEVTCDATELNAIALWAKSFNGTFPICPTITGSTIFDGTYCFADANNLSAVLTGLLDTHCSCLNNSNDPNDPNCGNCGGNTRGPGEGSSTGFQGNYNNMPSKNQQSSNRVCWDNIDPTWAINGSFPTITYTTAQDCKLTSNAWTSFSTSGGVTTGINPTHTNDPSVDADNYFRNQGQRYGLTPEHAQINGSFFIDCMRGNIHFGSNFSGKTVILHYISDGHGTEDEEIVHKFAEEAMYKWIAYGCAQARVDVDPNTIARLKKERFAETRKAKIRLSNLKIEEVAQVMRNKSKWIKH